MGHNSYPELTFLPDLLTLLVKYGIGNFTHSLPYDYHMAIVCLPFLRSIDGLMTEKRRRRDGEEPPFIRRIKREKEGMADGYSFFLGFQYFLFFFGLLFSSLGVSCVGEAEGAACPFE